MQGNKNLEISLSSDSVSGAKMSLASIDQIIESLSNIASI